MQELSRRAQPFADSLLLGVSSRNRNARAPDMVPAQGLKEE